MTQLYEINRKVLYNNSGHLSIEELWHYLGHDTECSWARGREVYISGEHDDAGNFKGENQILQDNIIGYIEDNLEIWNEYLSLIDKIKRLTE